MQGRSATYRVGNPIDTCAEVARVSVYELLGRSSIPSSVDFDLIRRAVVVSKVQYVRCIYAEVYSGLVVLVQVDSYLDTAHDIVDSAINVLEEHALRRSVLEGYRTVDFVCRICGWSITREGHRLGRYSSHIVA